MKIDTDLIKQISDGVNSLLGDYSTEIEEAAELDGIVTISLPVKLEEDGPNTNICVGISFVKTKIKDAVTMVASPQKELFED